MDTIPNNIYMNDKMYKYLIKTESAINNITIIESSNEPAIFENSTTVSIDDVSIDETDLNKYDIIDGKLVDASIEELARRNTALRDMWKRIKLKEMDNYPYINRGAYTINGESIYFDKAQRAAFITDIEANIADGTNTTWLWINNSLIKVDCNDFKSLIYKLNDYSQRCFNMTSNVRVAVKMEADLESLKAINLEDWLPVNEAFTIKDLS